MKNRAAFLRERKADPRGFDPRSFRTVTRGSHRLIVGCRLGEWDPRTGRCRVGTRLQAILHPTHEAARLLRAGRKLTVGRGRTERAVTPMLARGLGKVAANPGALRIHSTKRTREDGTILYSVLIGGQPVMADTTIKANADIVLARTIKAHPAAEVWTWDGDTGEEKRLSSARRANPRPPSMLDALSSGLRSRFSPEDVSPFDIQAAIWWFANDYHTGQASELYSVLSESAFSPGPLHRSVKDEGEGAEMAYNELVHMFRPPHRKKNPLSYEEARQIQSGMHGDRYQAEMGKSRGEIFRMSYFRGRQQKAHEIISAYYPKKNPLTARTGWMPEVYEARQRWPKYNVRVSPLIAGYSDAGRMLRQRLPGYTKEQHIAAGDSHVRNANLARMRHRKLVDDAMRALGGLPPGPLISGIVSERFPLTTKDRLRALAHEDSARMSAAMAHYAAARLHFDTARDRLTRKSEKVGANSPIAKPNPLTAAESREIAARSSAEAMKARDPGHGRPMQHFYAGRASGMHDTLYRYGRDSERHNQPNPLTPSERIGLQRDITEEMRRSQRMAREGEPRVAMFHEGKAAGKEDVVARYASNPRRTWEVIVGNIGRVYSGASKAEAEMRFNEYVSQSKGGYGRAAGEGVTLMVDGEIIREYVGSVEPNRGPKSNPLTKQEVKAILRRAVQDERQGEQEERKGLNWMAAHSYGRARRGREIASYFVARPSRKNPLLQTVMLANPQQGAPRWVNLVKMSHEEYWAASPLLANARISASYTGGWLRVRNWDLARAKKVLSMPRCNPACANPRHGHKIPKPERGLRVVYLPANQAWALMWHDQMLRIFNVKAEAIAEMKRLLVSGENPLTRREAADTLRSARRDLASAKQGRIDWPGGIATPLSGKERRYHAARAEGKAWTVRMHGEGGPSSDRLMIQGRRLALKNPAIPWRVGQRIPVAKARAWVVGTGDRELLRQFDEAYRLQAKANKRPQHVVWRTLPIGAKRKIEMVTAMTHYGDSPETYYVPPKGSHKGKVLYRHQWGETGGKRSVPLLAAHGGKALVMPLTGKKVAGDWLRH